MTTKPLPPAWSETALWLTLPVTRQGCRFGFPSPSLSWESPGWPDNVPFSRNQRIRRRTGNRPPTSAIDPKTRAHSRTIVTPPAGCFSHPEVSGRRAPVTRLASLEQPLVAQRTPIDPARRPTSHRLSTTLGASANSATESGTRVASSWHPSHWSVTDGPDSAKVRLGPAARTGELSNEPEYLLPRETRPRNPGGAGAPSFGPGTEPRLLRL